MNIEIIKTKRKSVAIEIKPDLRIVVRVPLRMSKRDIERFIEEKSDWINKNSELVRKRTEAENQLPAFTDCEIKRLKSQAKQIIPARVEHLAEQMGLSYNRVWVKSQATRWGSCSSLKNLNFNCLLVLCPTEVMDYIIIHELCHLKEMNHSKKFWAEVKLYCPNCEACKKWLKTDGYKLISRVR